MKWNSAIVGLGQIGMGYDFDQVGVQLTHATAYHLHPNFNLIAGIDPSAERRQQFEKKFDSPAYSSIADFAAEPANSNVNCFSIAAPTNEHFRSFLEIHDQRFRLTQLKAILCEKPIADSVESARSMVAQASKNGWLFAINYIRRTVPEFREIQAEIQSGGWGKLQKGAVFYSKGLLNSGTHWIDLMRFFFGEPLEARLLSGGSRRPLISQTQDYEPDFLLRFNFGEIYFCACDEAQYSMGSVDLMLSRGCVRINESGFSIERFFVGADSLAPQLQVLLPEPKATKTQLSQNMKFVLDDLRDCFLVGREPISNGESGLKTLEIADSLVQSLLKSVL